MGIHDGMVAAGEEVVPVLVHEEAVGAGAEFKLVVGQPEGRAIAGIGIAGGVGQIAIGVFVEDGALEASEIAGPIAAGGHQQADACGDQHDAEQDRNVLICEVFAGHRDRPAGRSTRLALLAAVSRWRSMRTTGRMMTSAEPRARSASGRLAAPRGTRGGLNFSISAISNSIRPHGR